MRGKVAVVTGGNRSIGRAIAIGFAEAGAAVAIAARDEAKNEETVAELCRLGARAVAVRADVADRGDLENMAATVTHELGPIDVLVNNAGIGFHADALTLSDEECQRLFSINLDGVWKASQVVGAQMAARGSGSIIKGRSLD